ncbi:MAG: hypothetical protein ACFBZ8_13300 [Opitutales bacterium]
MNALIFVSLTLTAGLLLGGCSRTPNVEQAVVDVAWESSQQAKQQAEIDAARVAKLKVKERMVSDAQRIAECAALYREQNEVRGVLVNDLIGPACAVPELLSGAYVTEVVLIEDSTFTLRHREQGLTMRFAADGRLLPSY